MNKKTSIIIILQVYVGSICRLHFWSCRYIFYLHTQYTCKVLSVNILAMEMFCYMCLRKVFSSLTTHWKIQCSLRFEPPESQRNPQRVIYKPNQNFKWNSFTIILSPETWLLADRRTDIQRVSQASEREVRQAQRDFQRYLRENRQR